MLINLLDLVILNVNYLNMAVIERKAKVFSVFNNEYLPASFIENFDNKSVSYTAGFGDTGLSVGIPVSKQTKCPEFVKVVGVDPNNPNWTEEVANFWAEFEYKVPLGKIGKNNKVEDGLEIDGSYEESEDGKLHPVDVKGYILLNLMENDIEVAKSVGDWPHKSQYKFFCLDTTKQKQEEEKSIKDAGLVLLRTAKLISKKDNNEVLKFILQIFNTDVSPIEIGTYNRLDLEAGIMQLAQTKPSALVEATEEGYNLEQKAFIRELVHSGAINQQGSVYFNGVNKLASSDEEMIRWLLDPTNGNTIQQLQAVISNYRATNVIKPANSL